MEDKKECVLVTGSSGLIGSAVVERLVDRFEIIGMDQPGAPHPPPAAKCVDVDLADEQSVRDGLNTVRKDFGSRLASVIHLAAYYDFTGEPSPKYDEITVRGTEWLLKGLQSFEVEQFLFSSTMLVHAPCRPGERITEGWPLEPKWDYPRSKVETEKLLCRKHANIPLVLARIAGVYDDRCHSIPIAHQIDRIYQRKLTSHVYPGDTSCGQSFVHLGDVVEAIALAVDRRHTLPSEFPVLIGEPTTLSYEEMQREFGRLIHGDDEWQTRQIPKGMAKVGAWVQDALPGDDPFIKPWMIDLADDHYALDITRARTQLGWENTHSLYETLPKMVAALKADPLRWYQENKLDPPAELEEEVPSGHSAGKSS